MDNDQHHELEKELLLKLNIVEEKLAELLARWPAHSVHANMMAELEALEEDRDCLRDLLFPKPSMN